MNQPIDFSEDLRRRRSERPFRPFEIVTRAGERLRVFHAFDFAINVRGVLVPGEGGPVRFTDISQISDTAPAERTR